MKKIILILIFNMILIMMFLTSCKENIVTNSGSNSNVLSGKIENWHLGSDKYVVAYAERFDTVFMKIALDSSNIDNTGSFILHFVTPPDSVLSNIKFYDSSFCTGEIIVNPQESRFSYILLQINVGGNGLGTIWRSSDSLDPHTGQCMVWNLYADRNGTISGHDSCNYTGFIAIESFNVNSIKGWNSWFVKYNDYDTNKVNETITSSQPQEVKWYFRPYYISQNRLLGKRIIP
jgi:hypothetical protein